ncbi:MAG TPA: SPOR domain-containing protein [Gaiella sp.]|jgi:hypothetical protein
MTERPPDAPDPDAPPVAEAGPPEPRCYRCGNPHDPFQEYCLECGARLVPLPGGMTRSTLFQRESPFWFWGAFLGLLAIALVAAGIVLAARDDDGGGGAGSSSGVAPTTIPIVPPTTGITTTPLPTTVAPPTQSTTIPTLPTTTAPTTTAPTTTAPTTTAATNGLTQWPANTDGWTVVVASVPKGDGRSAAETKARQAQSKGLPETGVLDGDQYASLTNGYYAVFSGVYDTKSEADGHLSQARASYPSAYVKAVN